MLCISVIRTSIKCEIGDVDAVIIKITQERNGWQS